jgi:hypothetical protein
MPVISALGKARQEDLEFEASVNFIARLCLKKKKRRVRKVNIMETFCTHVCKWKNETFGNYSISGDKGDKGE